jgi:hypothetical protein
MSGVADGGTVAFGAGGVVGSADRGAAGAAAVVADFAAGTFAASDFWLPVAGKRLGTHPACRPITNNSNVNTPPIIRQTASSRIPSRPPNRRPLKKSHTIPNKDIRIISTDNAASMIMSRL